MRAPRWRKFEPCASYSSGHHPEPDAQRHAAADSWSMVATCSATRSGSWMGSWKMPVPTRSVRVRAATAIMKVSGSLWLPGMKW